MIKIKAKRGNAKGIISRAATFAESVDMNTPVAMIENRLVKLEETWSIFIALHEQLFDFLAEPGFVDPEPEFEEYETKYFIAQSIFANFLQAKKSLNAPVQSLAETLASQQATFLEKLNSSKTPSSISLPKISIPIFSGEDYKDWPTFKDMFTGSVDSNPSLTSTHKFYLLKSFLSGNASKLLNGIAISEDNYLEAWEKLEQRYDRPHLIIQSFIQTFLSLPSINVSNVTLLRKLTDCADEVIRGLNAINSNDRDPWIIHLLVSKLDPETRQSWAEKIGSKSDSTVNELLEFLQNRCICLESVSSSSSSRSIQNKGKGQSVIRSHVVESKKCMECPLCKEEHQLTTCKQFLTLAVDSRRSLVKEKSLCFNCLRAGHTSNRCKSDRRCKTCHARHHSLVHLSSSSPNSTDNPSLNISNTSTSSSNQPKAISSPLSLCSSMYANGNSSCSQTLLPTAVGRVQNNQGEFQSIRLLLDSGSQVSFVTEEAVQRLGLVRKKARIPVVGVGSTSAGVTNGFVTLHLFSRYSHLSIEIQCYIISTLTSVVPASKISIFDRETFSSYSLADPNFNVPGNIDVLIGADKVFSIFNGSAVQGQQGVPDLVPSIFGWVVCGNMEQLTSCAEGSLSSFVTHLDTSEPFDFERFWRLEEVHVEPILSTEDQRAEDIFARTHTRLPDARYSVQLPFKSDQEIDFGNSLNVAMNRFRSLEKRLDSDPDLRESYVRFMREYLELGHMKEIQPIEIPRQSSKCFYLPHHAVVKKDSSTTKVRVVFDASAKSGSYPSLNESLLIGQTHQRDLFSICLRFRRHKYTISGDIEKMYRQINVSEDHTDFQRILWRESSDLPLKHYRLMTVTYGTACAPFLAVRTLYQLALDSKEKYPRAAEILLNDFYIDDVMTGADSIEDITSLRLELVSLLQSGGFNLRKWTTNCWPLLLSLPEDQREISPKEFEDCNSVKLLGLQWSPLKDSFSYKVNLNDYSTFTKRRILSESSKIFDPIGFLAPVVIGVKILLQEFWRSKYNWDDVISDEHSSKWCAIRQELPILETLNIPRGISMATNSIQFHAFCDASLDAYAAVVYCRSEDANGNVTTNIVAAKSRVAPIKVISLPRLELCGAVLLTRLVNKLKTSLQFKDMKVFAWTDSTIVLHWLSALPKKWSVFISNRTSEILSSMPRETWRHVRSEDNPADCASRGILPSHLPLNDLWWNGPSWIRLQSDQWPSSKPSIETIQIEHLEERRTKQTQVFVSAIKPTNLIDDLIKNCSRYLKIIRVFAYIRRFIAHSRVKRSDGNKRELKPIRTLYIPPLSCDEIMQSKVHLIKLYQCQNFSSEIASIRSGKDIKRGSKLISLNPFIDNEGVLRVGGRLQESDLAYSSKHPIIIDKASEIARKIVEHIHNRNQHASVSQMFAILRQEYYIVGCRSLLRKVVFDCVECFRYKKTTSVQLMGNLPADRVLFSRPFSKVGVDYAGPITLRVARGRNPKFVKGYIALFVCFATKAIHLELVSDLSSAAFLAALDRFVSRRGKPVEIFSDNGTNFHGAKRNLNEMFQLLISQQHNDIVIDHLSKDSIAWTFIPPSAPHFGGLWEAGVKSVKFHLKRVTKDHRLTYEEMYTLLTQIEALLNSRPMWPMSDMDPIALSPAHFLIGEPYTSVPRPDICTKSVCPITNWSLLQTLKQGFWKRWHAEYLTSLQQRPKWQNTKANLEVNDVVMLKDPNLPPSKWILGRVKAVHPGKDNRARVATIQTQTGDYVRPIIKLAPLPFSERPRPFRGG